MIRASVVTSPSVPDRLAAEVADAGNGATAVFVGTVRRTNEGREVSGIEYSAYRSMAEREMTAILNEAAESFDFSGAVIEHRVGKLAVGEISIAVVVAAPHRRPAIDAMSRIVEETKKRAPVWKLEHYVDGTREWVGASGEVPA
jgi:molybdopterin synthase catalytic subunit